MIKPFFLLSLMLFGVVACGGSSNNGPEQEAPPKPSAPDGTPEPSTPDGNSEPSTPDGLLSDIVFEDQNLKACVMDAAQSQGITLIDDMQELDCSYRGIASLTGIEKLIKLESLNVNGWHDKDINDGEKPNTYKDLSPLSQIPTLTSLDMQWMGFTDSQVLSELTNLEHLDISDNDFKELNGLSGLTNLSVLLADYNLIDDISGLAGLTQLREVSLLTNGIDNVTPLAHLTRLTHLDISHNDRIKSLAPIGELTALKFLDLSGNFLLEDFSPISTLVNLEGLALSSTEFSTPEHLKNLTKLTSLGLYYTSIK